MTGSSSLEVTHTADSGSHSPVQVTLPSHVLSCTQSAAWLHTQGGGVDIMELPEAAVVKGRLWLVQEGSCHTEARHPPQL